VTVGLDDLRGLFQPVKMEQKDELEPHAAPAVRKSFWRTEEMVLSGGFPASLEAQDLIRSSQPLPSRCLYGFFT